MGPFILIWEKRQLAFKYQPFEVNLKLVLGLQLPKTMMILVIESSLNAAWLRQLQPQLAFIPLGVIARDFMLLVDFFMLKLLCRH